MRAAVLAQVTRPGTTRTPAAVPRHPQGPLSYVVKNFDEIPIGPARYFDFVAHRLIVSRASSMLRSGSVAAERSPSSTAAISSSVSGTLQRPASREFRGILPV